MLEHTGSRSLVPASLEDGEPTYSICTMVTRHDEYEAMVASFRAGGFDDAEFLHVDNSSKNVADAYTALNLFLAEARRPYLILCHQDILLLEDGRQRLDQLVAELSAKHPKWALAGNAGVTPGGRQAIRITDPHGSNQARGGPFPVRAAALDENFIVARRSANLALSIDLSGFHLYGTDMCLHADSLGWEAYVIDFHLHHKSRGNIDESLRASRKAMSDKYLRLMTVRWHPSLFGYPIYLGPSRLLRFIARLARKAGLGRFNRV
jgi:hypothetical protein